MPTATRNITLPMPHPGQQYVRTNMRRMTWVRSGRRWRKTTLGMSLAVEDVLTGHEDLWTAPTFDQVRIAWNEMKKATSGVFTFNTTQMMAEFGPTGGRIKFRSLDNPDNARGHTVTGRVFMDEAAFVADAAWYEILRPMLMDSGGGGFFMFTPNGRNWVWRECEAAAHRSDSAAFHAPSVGAEIRQGELIRVPHPLENPDIPWDEIVNLFHTMPERTFRQEILAEFVEDAGGVFHNVDDCIGGQLQEHPTRRETRYVMGVDLAKYNDYTVCCVMEEETQRVVDFHRFNHASWPVQKGRIKLIADHWNNALTYIDSTGIGDPIFDDLARAGMRITPYKFTHLSKQDLIDNAVMLIGQRKVTYPRIPVLVDELKSYQYDRTPGGTLRMNAPSGQHDDCVIAFALACWPLKQMGGYLAPMVSVAGIERTTDSPFGGRGLMEKRF